MSTSWDEASACPADGLTGKVTSRKQIPRLEGGGQMITLSCPNERCEYNGLGWIVQTRADGSIPDKVDPTTRDKNFSKSRISWEEKQRMRDLVAMQVEAEQRPGYEIRGMR
jgi:hypothetical protein